VRRAQRRTCRPPRKLGLRTGHIGRPGEGGPGHWRDRNPTARSTSWPRKLPTISRTSSGCGPGTDRRVGTGLTTFVWFTFRGPKNGAGTVRGTLTGLARGRATSAAPAPFANWISGGGKVEPVDAGQGCVRRRHRRHGWTRPGHTPGHHSLLARLREMGNVLLSGDLEHFRENYEDNV